MSSSKTALVAGGAGFIGSHLCERLLKENRQVICLDNLYSGRLENVKTLENNPRFTFVNFDVSLPLNFTEKIDEIYNLASPASPIHYQKDPIFTASTNFNGTKNLLDLAFKNQARFLQASTSEVYGDPLEHPQKETYWGNVNPIGPRSCYDEGKRIAETLCVDYRRLRNLDVKIIRIFNTYGPRMREDDGRVVSNFITQALCGENLTIYGDGSQTRSFQYVDDLIEGILAVMERDIETPINLGNPDEYQIEELAEKIIKLTSSKSKIVFRPLPSDDPTRRRPDIAKAKALLDWSPKISLEEGLLRTIDFFRSVL